MPGAWPLSGARRARRDSARPRSRPPPPQRRGQEVPTAAGADWTGQSPTGAAEQCRDRAGKGEDTAPKDAGDGKCHVGQPRCEVQSAATDPVPPPEHGSPGCPDERLQHRNPPRVTEGRRAGDSLKPGIEEVAQGRGSPACAYQQPEHRAHHKGHAGQTARSFGRMQPHPPVPRPHQGPHQACGCSRIPLR